MTTEMRKRFFEDRDDTGRFTVKSFVTGVEYFVEPIGDGRMADWGSYNPSTGNIENKKGAGKYAGSVTEKESIVTEANGFKNIIHTEVGVSPLETIEQMDRVHELNGVRPKK